MLKVEVNIQGSQGAGKTTLALELATLLHARGFDVVISEGHGDTARMYYVAIGRTGTAVIRTKQEP